MWSFYWTLTREIPKALWNAADLWVSITAAALFFIALFNQKLEEKLTISWHALSPWWSVLPVGVFLLYALMRSNYKHYRQMESNFNSKIATLNSEVDDLKKTKIDLAKDKLYYATQDAFAKLSERAKEILRYTFIHEQLFAGDPLKALGVDTRATIEIINAELLTSGFLRHRCELIGNAKPIWWEIPPGYREPLRKLLFS